MTATPAAEAAPAEPAALVCAMRNEGPFVVEWLAYHRVIGFDPVLIATNACTDGTDLLVDRLAAGGAVVHLPNPVAPGDTPQDAALRLALAWLAAQDGPDWVAHLDSDEFLNIRAGAGGIATLTAAGQQAEAIALAWRAFGHDGHDIWPGETLPAFTACDAQPVYERVKFKSLFRRSAFAHSRDHLPCDPRIPAPRAVSAGGRPLSPDTFTAAARQSRYRPFRQAVDWTSAQVNHYTRSRDVFAMKNDRGDGQGKAVPKYRLGGAWHRLADGAGAEDRSILRHWPAVQAEMARLRALPGVAAAEADCVAAFTARRDSLLTPARRHEWTRHPARSLPCN